MFGDLIDDSSKNTYIAVSLTSSLNNDQSGSRLC